MFNKIVGNNHIKQIFQRILGRQNVPNSLLLTGEEGVGKKTFAVEIAKSLVCRNPQNFVACDECSACQRASRFNFPKPDDRDAHKKIIFSEHPDVGMIIPYNKNILVDAVREIEGESNFLPYEAKSRIFIIDDAEKMNDAAANALLKTLEEPAKSSYIFLVTAHPAALLPTIRSRCQVVRFAPLAAQEIEDYLRQTQKFAPDDAELLANLSQGSLGRALSMDLGKFREQRETMLNLLENLVRNENRAVLLKTAEELNDAKNKDHFEQFLDILQLLIHDIWTLRLGKEEIANLDLRLRLITLAKDARLKQLATWQTDIENLREQFAVNLNKKIATDSIFMKMSERRPG